MGHVFCHRCVAGLRFTPYSSLGTPQEYMDQCGSAISSGYAMVASDIATDLITLIIPIPVVVGTSLNLRAKLLALLIFMIGAL